MHTEMTGTVGASRIPRWVSVVGLAVALVGVGASVWFGLHGLRRRGLEAATTTCISLVDVKDEVRGRIQVLYDGRDVPNISKCMYEVRNFGNEPIRPEDIVVMPYLQLPKEMGVLDCRITYQDTKDLGASVDYDTASGRCRLNLSLLNPSDGFAFEVIYTGNIVELPALQGRISGVKQIVTVARPTEHRSPVRTKSLFLKVLSSVFAALLLFIGTMIMGINWGESTTSGRKLRAGRRALNQLDKVRTEGDMQAFLDAWPSAANDVDEGLLRQVLVRPPVPAETSYQVIPSAKRHVVYKALPPLRSGLASDLL